MESFHSQHQGEDARTSWIAECHGVVTCSMITSTSDVTRKVIKKFEPWMALTFSEGSIGGDIEKRESSRARGVLRRKRTPASAHRPTVVVRPEPTGSNGIAIAPSITATKHAMLLINPHTSFFFRSEAQVLERRGTQRVRRGDVGTVLRLPGLQQPRRLDAHVERRGQHRRVRRDRSMKKGDSYVYKYGRGASARRRRRSACRTSRALAWRSKEFTVYRTHHGPIIREADGKWVAIRLMQEPVNALTQSYTARRQRVTTSTRR